MSITCFILHKMLFISLFYFIRLNNNYFHKSWDTTLGALVSFRKGLKQCYSNVFARGSLLASKKIATDPHILAHVNIDCPDDRYYYYYYYYWYSALGPV